MVHGIPRGQVVYLAEISLLVFRSRRSVIFSETAVRVVSVTGHGSSSVTGSDRSDGAAAAININNYSIYY